MNALNLASDADRCRWPECDCYSPGGPKECRRQAVNAPTHAEILIGRRSANQALLESRLGECVNHLSEAARLMDGFGCQRLAAEYRAVVSCSDAALRTIREAEEAS